MALDKMPTAVVEAPVAVGMSTKQDSPFSGKKDYTGEDKRVRGQVRMHAIIAGYRVGGMLAATLGTSPASVREELHKLAAEVADKIEEYSFKD